MQNRLLEKQLQFCVTTVTKVFDGFNVQTFSCPFWCTALQMLPGLFARVVPLAYVLQS